MGLGKISQARSQFSSLSKSVSSGLNTMQQKIAKFSGMVMLGGMFSYAGSKLNKFVDGGLAEFEKIQVSTVRLRGKLRDMSKTKFNNLIRDIKEVGRVTKFTEDEALDGADAIRALGMAPNGILKSTQSVLNFATAAESLPKLAAKAMVSGKNAFKMNADEPLLICF